MIKSKIKNQKSKIRQRGFTLIELLAVMIVLISVGTILSSILISALRGSNKTNTTSTVRQNGFFAMSQMSKMLREARRLESPVTCNIPPNPTPMPTVTQISIVSPDDGSTTFTCSSNTISSNSAYLLDPTAVSLVSCYFTCGKTSTSDYPVIGINFSLTEYKITGTQLLPERSASGSAIPFQTSVTLRNINR